jgi:hypothetical protein
MKQVIKQTLESSFDMEGKVSEVIAEKMEQQLSDIDKARIAGHRISLGAI